MIALMEGTKRRLYTLIQVLLSGTLIGICHESLIGFAGWNAPGMGGLIGVIHGFTKSTLIGLLEIFAVRTKMGRRLQRAPFTMIVVVKGSLYGMVIVAVELGQIGERLIMGYVKEPLFQNPMWRMTIVFSVVFTFVFIFVLQVSQLVGRQTLRDLVLGRYHHSRTESPAFLLKTRFTPRLLPTLFLWLLRVLKSCMVS